MSTHVTLSRFLSRALRHQPGEYGLILDQAGFASLSAVWRVVQTRFPNAYSFDDLYAICAPNQSGVRRFEIKDSPPRIRALYGHSREVTPITYVRTAPPELLYHGTSKARLSKIRKTGLKAGRRQYVHLTDDVSWAGAIATRQAGEDAVVLTIRAAEANQDGIAFYHPEKDLFLAEFVPARYLDFPPETDAAQPTTDWLRLALRFMPERAVFVVDPQFRFLIAEGPAALMYADRSEHLIGRAMDDILPPAVLAYGKRLARQTLAGETLNDELVMNGRIILHRTYPIIDERGNVIAAVILVQDVSEQRRIEDALHESQRFVERVTTTIPDAVYVYDLEHRRSIYNNREIAAILGYSANEILAMGDMVLPSLLHPDDFERQQRGLQRFDTAADGDVVESMYRIRHRDGRYRWVFQRDTVFLRGADGRPRQILGVAQDVTERLTAQEAALEGERLRLALQKQQELGHIKTGLMRRIAQEFRTPLANVQMSAELLGTFHDRLTPPQRLAQVDRIKIEIKKLTDMLTDIGLIVDGRFMDMQSAKTQFDLAHDVYHLTQRLASSLGEHHHLQTKLPSHPVTVLADQPMIQALFINVLTNAIKYSPPETTIDIQLATTETESISLTVRDHGRGITPDDLAHVHEAFYRGTNVGGIGGIGIGLTIANGVVEAHQGSMTITSEPGEGTTLHINLPIRVLPPPRH